MFLRLADESCVNQNTSSDFGLRDSSVPEENHPTPPGDYTTSPIDKPVKVNRADDRIYSDKPGPSRPRETLNHNNDNTEGATRKKMQAIEMRLQWLREDVTRAMGRVGEMERVLADMKQTR